MSDIIGIWIAIVGSAIAGAQLFLAYTCWKDQRRSEWHKGRHDQFLQFEKCLAMAAHNLVNVVNGPAEGVEYGLHCMSKRGYFVMHWRIHEVDARAYSLTMHMGTGFRPEMTSRSLADPAWWDYAFSVRINEGIVVGSGEMHNGKNAKPESAYSMHLDLVMAVIQGISHLGFADATHTKVMMGNRRYFDEVAVYPT